MIANVKFGKYLYVFEIKVPTLRLYEFMYAVSIKLSIKLLCKCLNIISIRTAIEGSLNVPTYLA